MPSNFAGVALLLLTLFVTEGEVVRFVLDGLLPILRRCRKEVTLGVAAEAETVLTLLDGAISVSGDAKSIAASKVLNGVDFSRSTALLDATEGVVLERFLGEASKVG